MELAVVQLAMSRGLVDGRSFRRELLFEDRFIATTTERDSNSAIHAAPTTYSFSKREYCYEEGWFRGASGFSTSKSPPTS